MARKIGQSRSQYGMFATPLEEMIDGENPVRVIDAFVDSLDLEQLGFRAVKDKEKVAREMALVFSCYNLRRTVSILGVKDLILALKTRFLLKTTFLSPVYAPVFYSAGFYRLKFNTLKSHAGAFALAA